MNAIEPSPAPQSRRQFDDDFEWILYFRISFDRFNDELGVKRQEREGGAAADRLGGRVLIVLVDNDLTANTRSKRHKRRPAYEQMCALLTENPGRRGVIAWHTDRLHRSPRELEDFIDIVERTAAAVHTVQTGPIDLTTASGRMVARQLCAVARFESEHKADRIRAKNREIAADGRIGGGGYRPFGYRRVYSGDDQYRRIVRDEVHPDEAAIVRDLCRRLLVGETRTSLLRWLNASGIATTTGARWSAIALSRMLRSGRIAGLREYNGKIVGPAVWPAIIDRDTHEQVRAMLDNKSSRPVVTVRRHYLTGFVVCSACHPKGLRMSVESRSHDGKLQYRCDRTRGGCGGHSIVLQGLKNLMDQYMVGRLNQPGILADLAQREARTDEVTAALLVTIDADERRLVRLRTMLRDGGDAEQEEAQSLIATVVKRKAANQAELARHTPISALGNESLPDLAARWPDLPVERQHALVSLFVERIAISQARPGPRFDPDRVDIIPRGGARAGSG